MLLAALAAGAVGLVRRQAQERAERAAFAVEAGQLVVPGLAAPVEVLRDARGVAHVQAVREDDAWLGLGLVQAQDRLAQMLWLRRLARGRTAEVLGDAGLPADRLARTLGIGTLADAEAERLDAETMSVLEAFAAGVNARIARIREGHERAPLALREPVSDMEDWTPADSVAVLKLVSWSTGNLIETGLVLDDLIERLGSQLARPFRPTGVGVRGVEIAGDLSPDEVARSASGGAIDDAPFPSRDLVRSVTIEGGTAAVLSGRHTESGAPILIADLHLPPTAPPLVYEVHVRGGAVDVSGATIPGLPVVWAGRNLDVAWAAIPARAVTVDLYKETLRGDGSLYQNGSRWVALEERVESIRVRTATGFEEVEWPVRATRHGPLIGALLRERPHAPVAGTSAAPPSARPSRREPLALAWTGAIPGDGIGSLLRVARARSGAEVVAALEDHHEPVVAVVYADRAGRAGLELAGWLPRRTLPTSLVPVPGRLRLFDWRDRIDPGQLPRRVLDARADAPRSASRRPFLAFADGPVGDEPTEPGIEWLWRIGETQDRLDRVLRQMTSADHQAIRSTRPARGRPTADIRAAMRVLSDVGGRAARDVVPALLRLARRPGPLRPEAAEIADLLAAWDGGSGPDSRGAAAYHVLVAHLADALFRAPFGDALYARYRALPGVQPGAVVESIVIASDRAGASGGWTDPDRLAGEVRAALRRTWVSLSYRLGARRAGWTWSRLHPLAFTAFGSQPPRPAPGIPAVGIGGDETTIAVAGFRGEPGFAVGYASGFRMAVDLATPDRMLTSLAPGQSEHPGHPHFADGLSRWIDGRPSLLLTSRLLVEEEAGARLLLEPAP
jgi:penicillin amidase